MQIDSKGLPLAHFTPLYIFLEIVSVMSGDVRPGCCRCCCCFQFYLCLLIYI